MIEIVLIGLVLVFATVVACAVVKAGSLVREAVIATRKRRR